MPDRSVCFIPGKFCVGNDALVRSFSASLAERAPGLSVRPPGGGAAIDAAVVAVAPTGADAAAARQAVASLTGLVPRDRLRVVAWHEGIEGGLSIDDLRASLGQVDDVWPFDPEAALAAEAAGVTVHEIRPRSRLARAIAATAAAVAACVTGGEEPPRLGAAEVASAVARRVWRRIEAGNGGGQPIESEIESELASYLGETGGRLETGDLAEARRRLREDVLGLGPIERYLSDPEVSEVMVNGAGAIYLERAGRVLRAPASFSDEDRLRLAISRIVSPAGRRVDLSSPLCDARLPDGCRANVVLPPVAVDGPLLTIRRFRPAFETLEDLIGAGTITEADAARLREAVSARRNLVIAGNSGAGKTTLLNAVAALIPDDERIITLEDAAELRIRKPHVVRLETRPANAEGRGEVSMRDLVINALRMRPDRLIVGECRGAEAIPMLQAMNTGHDGSLTTLHANSAADVVERLESMVLIGAPQWPPEVVRRQIRSAVHLVAYLRRTGGVRRLESLGPLETA
jgi:pilus assembly protein CpaF